MAMWRLSCPVHDGNACVKRLPSALNAGGPHEDFRTDGLNIILFLPHAIVPRNIVGRSVEEVMAVG